MVDLVILCVIFPLTIQINVNGTGLNYVSCEVGNPFPQDHTMQFTITVRLEDFHNIDDTELLFTFNTESSFSADTNKADNSFSCK